MRKLVCLLLPAVLAAAAQAASPPAITDVTVGQFEQILARIRQENSGSLSAQVQPRLQNGRLIFRVNAHVRPCWQLRMPLRFLSLPRRRSLRHRRPTRLVSSRSLHG